MKWTTELPKKDGYYWVRRSHKSITFEVVEIYIRDGKPVIAHDEYDEPADYYTHFCKIEMPLFDKEVAG
jgi:hypothetical protein